MIHMGYVRSLMEKKKTEIGRNYCFRLVVFLPGEHIEVKKFNWLIVCYGTLTTYGTQRLQINKFVNKKKNIYNVKDVETHDQCTCSKRL